ASLAAIGQALGDNGDLLLWSCQSGQGGRGAAFVDALAGATGAGVAAAGGLVGAASRGGRWELDTRHPAAQALPPLTARGQAAYAGVLDTLNDNNTTGVVVTTTTATTVNINNSTNDVIT